MEEQTTNLEAKAINIHVDLIERAKGNDQEAQFDLYKKYNGAMYNTALRITHNTALAEDVIQESFLNAFQSLDYYRGDASFGSWLKRIVINKAISLSKKESKWELRDDETSFEKVELAEEPVEYNTGDRQSKKSAATNRCDHCVDSKWHEADCGEFFVVPT